MTSKLQNKREDLVNLLLEITFVKLENKYFIFEVETSNSDTESSENWHTIYQMKNQKLKEVYSPSEEVECGCLDISESFNRTMKYLKKNNITQLNTIVGINYKGLNLLGVDMEPTQYDGETGIDYYATNFIDKNDWWLTSMLKKENISLDGPFQTKHNMLRYI
ncbi:MAG: hypothetical protein HRU03_06320 [Nanoarchaeales archaeon]|nr:hypothetical protein [Nanoarchaeales archaeon]